MSLHCLLYCIVSSDKSTFILIFVPLYITGLLLQLLYDLLFITGFKQNDYDTPRCNLLISFVWGSLSSLWVYSFHPTWKFFSHYSFKYFFCPSPSPLFWGLQLYMLRFLEVFPQFIVHIFFSLIFSLLFHFG